MLAKYFIPFFHMDTRYRMAKDLCAVRCIVGITTGDTRCAQRYAFTSIFMKSFVLLKCSSTL